MMKNYVKEGQKLPLFGVGPYIVLGMAVITVIGTVLFCYVLKVGTLGRPWTVIFRIAGGVFMAAGVAVWFTGSMRSGMDDNIAENKLKTDGIYACVRNPMYSGIWFLIFGASLMWHNIFLVPIVVINWIILSIALMNTEEKWLEGLYGEEYLLYKKRVNRCIPWFPKK
ncbi:Protein-S-isoprenylcysteine O-methyltransferase Ste14 [Lachnospiraceae bacterium XPB1003]|nr:Protein-S-isoprenylcysteine O-methyltransferase Ste14 [Lachnospiraceae bacterium XPB1003]